MKQESLLIVRGVQKTRSVDLNDLSKRLFAAANQLRTNAALRPDRYAQPVLALIASWEMEAQFDVIHAKLASKFGGRLKHDLAVYQAREAVLRAAALAGADLSREFPLPHRLPPNSLAKLFCVYGKYGVQIRSPFVIASSILSAPTWVRLSIAASDQRLRETAASKLAETIVEQLAQLAASDNADEMPLLLNQGSRRHVSIMRDYLRSANLIRRADREAVPTATPSLAV